MRKFGSVVASSHAGGIAEVKTFGALRTLGRVSQTPLDFTARAPTAGRAHHGAS